MMVANATRANACARALEPSSAARIAAALAISLAQDEGDVEVVVSKFQQLMIARVPARSSSAVLCSLCTVARAAAAVPSEPTVTASQQLATTIERSARVCADTRIPAPDAPALIYWLEKVVSGTTTVIMRLARSDAAPPVGTAGDAGGASAGAVEPLASAAASCAREAQRLTAGLLQLIGSVARRAGAGAEAAPAAAAPAAYATAGRAVCTLLSSAADAQGSSPQLQLLLQLLHAVLQQGFGAVQQGDCVLQLCSGLCTGAMPLPLSPLQRTRSSTFPQAMHACTQWLAQQMGTLTASHTSAQQVAVVQPVLQSLLVVRACIRLAVTRCSVA